MIRSNASTGVIDITLGSIGVIRRARLDDLTAIVQLVRDLAEYERAPDAALASEDDFRRALFGEHPALYCHIAEDDAGNVVGFAVWFLNFSTWVGRHGIYLEDLFVRPSARGHGYGQALLAELARICVERNYGRLEWAVLDWNEPALGFYRSLGAVSMDEWTVNRLSGDALHALGTSVTT
jgi:GNAT superfamily N-acetyltransferase